MAVAPTVSFSHLLRGIVVETNAESLTGSLLYSDYADRGTQMNSHIPENASKDSVLNKATRIPVVGIVAGVARVALGAIHAVGHLFAALITQNKGHLWHAAKGGCEMLRGIIEAIPVVGRIFANTFSAPDRCGSPDRSCWMIKMYNPEKPDGLDSFMHNWKTFPSTHYVKA